MTLASPLQDQCLINNPTGVTPRLVSIHGSPNASASFIHKYTDRVWTGEKWHWVLWHSHSTSFVVTFIYWSWPHMSLFVWMFTVCTHTFWINEISNGSLVLIWFAFAGWPARCIRPWNHIAAFLGFWIIRYIGLPTARGVAPEVEFDHYSPYVVRTEGGRFLDEC